MSRDEATVADIVRSCRLALEFVEDLSRSAFLADAKTQSAVLHQLLVIGEATKRLSASFTEANPEVPWREMAGMRDRLIHGYDAVDLELVWNTIQRDIRQLLKDLSAADTR